MFVDRLYRLSENTEMLIFFDRIKDVFGVWIDKELYGIEYELELIENINQYNDSWVSINLGLNRITDTFEKNIKLNDMKEWERFSYEFEKKFESRDKKRLRIDIEGDINIFNH